MNERMNSGKCVSCSNSQTHVVILGEAWFHLSTM
jgi:hypothetical protein